MRTKLLMTAATALALAWGASADTSYIEPKPTDIHQLEPVKPNAPAMANPTEAEFTKPDPDLHHLFDTLPLDAPEDANGFQQQARIEQEGDDNDANVDQTASEE